MLLRCLITAIFMECIVQPEGATSNCKNEQYSPLRARATAQAAESHRPDDDCPRLIIEFEEVGKCAIPAVSPLSHLSDEARGYVLSHRLSVNITCIYLLFAKFFQNVKIRPVMNVLLLNIKKDN